MLALKREACGKPKPQPRLWFSSGQNQYGNVRASRPSKRHEHIRVEIGAEILRRGDDTGTGEEHRVATAAHRARGQPCEEHLRRRKQHGHETNRKERVAEQVARRPGYDSYSRRLIDIPPGEMVAARNEVQFVAEESIALIECGVQNEGKKSEPAEEHPISMTLFDDRLGCARRRHRHPL